MLICSADDKTIEITHCDAGYPPGSKPMNIQDKTAVWFKHDGKWYRSKHISAIKTAHDIRHTNSSDLHTLSDFIPDLISMQEKTDG